MSQAGNGFPHAPGDWTREEGERVAKAEDVTMDADRWDVVRALQEYFERHVDDPAFRARELHDALDERFHHKGGLRYLYTLFPGGPVAQGCRIAGIKVPWIAIDRNFGSVM
jgi:tRNA 2-thiouridine synthesizing protein E